MRGHIGIALAAPQCRSTKVEEALLAASATGVSGIPLWDGSRPPARRGGDGRTFGSTTHGRRTALFFTNDRGVFVIDPAAPVATKLQEIEARDERARILALYDRHRRQLASERLPIPRRMPPLFGTITGAATSRAPRSSCRWPISAWC
jgi:hypothetical protein